MLLKRYNKQRKKDSDHDGLSDWEELHVYGTNPYKFDTDGDGMGDGDEVRLGRNPKGPGFLEDFLFPHLGNNHHPHSLRPKRIIFHLASVAVIKTIAVCFVLLFPMSAWLTPEISAAQSKKIIALTNELRKDKSLSGLTENTSLNQAAFKKAQDMLIGQYFAHTGPDSKTLNNWLGAVGYKYSVAGENLAMGFSDAGEVMKAWENSPTHYANLIDADFKEIGVAMTDGIFKGEETTLAAQYFARPVQEPQVAKTVKMAVNIQSTPAKASVVVSEPIRKKERIVMAQAELPADTTSANIVMGEKKIELQKTSSSTWAGSEIIADKDYKEIASPVIMASVNSTNASNTVTIASVASQDIKPQKISITDQYFLLKNNPNKNMQKVLDLSSFYFFFLLGIIAISLFVNVLGGMKKQHPALVLGGVSLAIVLMVFLIV